MYIALFPDNAGTCVHNFESWPNWSNWYNHISVSFILDTSIDLIKFVVADSTLKSVYCKLPCLNKKKNPVLLDESPAPSVLYA